MRFLATVEQPSELFMHGTVCALCAIHVTAALSVLRSGRGRTARFFLGQKEEIGLLINSVAFGVQSWVRRQACVSHTRCLAAQASVLASRAVGDEVLLAVCVEPLTMPRYRSRLSAWPRWERAAE